MNLIMTEKICTSCLKNYGIRIVAEKITHGKKKTSCENCGENGYLLNEPEINQLLHEFFVLGSVPPDLGGTAPIFQFNSYQYPSDLEFLTELDTDLKLLSETLKIGVFHYGPPLWSIGATNHYQDLTIENVSESERYKIWIDIIDKCSSITINPGKTIFRARKGNKLPPAIPEEFDSPPLGFTQEGRFNNKHQPMFYGAFDVETCLHEIRVSLSDYVMLATFETSKSLKILDLTRVSETSTDPFDSISIFLYKLFFSGKSEYALCQEFASEIKKCGYDGFISNSYFKQAHTNELLNINLFDHPVKDEKLKLTSTNRIILNNVNYQYSFGPTNDNIIPPDMNKLKEWKKDFDSIMSNLESGDINDKINSELIKINNQKFLESLKPIKSKTPR